MSNVLETTPYIVKIITRNFPHLSYEAARAFCLAWGWDKVGVNCDSVAELTDNISELSLFDEEVLTTGAIALLIKSRPPRQRSALTLVYGDSDLLSLQFLSRVLETGKRVCRLTCDYAKDDKAVESILGYFLARKYSVEDINTLVGSDATLWNGTTPAEALPSDSSDKAARLVRKKLIQKIKEKPFPMATGFLVGRNYLMTNHHVIDGSEALSKFYAQFLYDSSESQSVNYELAEIVHTNKVLDYTIIKLKALEQVQRQSINQQRQDLGEGVLNHLEAGDNFNWFSLSVDETLISPGLRQEQIDEVEDADLKERLKEGNIAGDPVTIIQHPQGLPKRIVLSSNRTQKLFPNYVQYQADADRGSSGSPVLNEQLQLVAIHHGALLSPVTTTTGKERLQVVGQLGIRMCQIVKDLQNQSIKEEDPLPNQSAIKKFLADVGLDPLQEAAPPKNHVYILAGRQRVKRLKPEEVALEVETMTALREEVVQLLRAKYPRIEPVFVIPTTTDEDEARKQAIAFINNPQQDGIPISYRPGDVAIELLLNTDDDPDTRGATIFYDHHCDNEKIQGDIIVHTLIKSVRNLPNRGAIADNVVASNGLEFCRDIEMPSMVLMVGFASNAKDKRLLKTRLPDFVEGVTEGLAGWVKTLRPEETFRQLVPQIEKDLAQLSDFV